MWYDIFIYSFSIFIYIIATVFYMKLLKPKTFSQKIGIHFIGIGCGIIAYWLVIIVSIIVILIKMIN